MVLYVILGCYFGGLSPEKLMYINNSNMARLDTGGSSVEQASNE